MNADIIAQWEKNKNKFEETLKRAVIKKTFRYEYEFLLSIIIKHVINRDSLVNYSREFYGLFCYFSFILIYYLPKKPLSL